jgi:hypothetical protein
MKEHPEIGRLQAHLDGELSPVEARELSRHLEGCSDCREALGGLETLARDTARALASLGPGEPDLAPALQEVRRRGGRRRVGRSRQGLAAAAAVVLLLGAGAAAAMPGSPLRAWLDARFGPDEAVPAAAEPLAERGEVTGAAALGVTVDLAQGELQVVFRGVPEGMDLEVEPTREARAGVFAPSESRFSTAPGRVEVEVRGAGDVLRVRIPESARLAEVRVDDTVVARVQDGDVVLPGRAAGEALDARIRIRIPSSGNPGNHGG